MAFSTNDQIKLLMCHFNWGLCKQITQSTLQERIDALNVFIEECCEDLLKIRSYTLLGYLKSLIDPKTIEIKEEVSKLFLKAKEYLPISKDGSQKEGLGNRAVIVANCWYWNAKLMKRKKVSEYSQEYKKICKEYEDIKNHPEAFAMKGYAFGHFSSFQKALESVKAYTKALSDKKYKGKAEWLFGIARSRILLSHRRDPQSLEDLSEIVEILHQAIEINSNYSWAMLTLARVLFRIYDLNAIEEIEYWIEAALVQNKEKVMILEEAAWVYIALSKSNFDYNEKALLFFNKAKKIKPNSKKTIEGLGQVYLNMFFKHISAYPKENGSLEILNQAIEYFEESARNKRHSDLLRLANVYSQKSRTLKKGCEYFGNQAENLYTKAVIQQLEKECECFRRKAEDQYIAVIEELEKEGEQLCIAPAYVDYAEFLKYFPDRQEDRIHYLKKVAAMSIDDEKLDRTEMRHIRQSYDDLLKDASQTKLSVPVALGIKGFVHWKKKKLSVSYFLSEKSKGTS